MFYSSGWNDSATTSTVANKRSFDVNWHPSAYTSCLMMDQNFRYGWDTERLATSDLVWHKNLRMLRWPWERSISYMNIRILRNESGTSSIHGSRTSVMTLQYRAAVTVYTSGTQALGQKACPQCYQPKTWPLPSCCWCHKRWWLSSPK